jgi:sarcosine oxidase subunit beta
VRAQWPDELEVRLSLESIAFYASAEQELEAPSPIERHGYLYLAADQAELAALEQRAAAAGRHGARIETLCPAALGDVVPGLRTDDLVGGVLGRDDGYGDPSAATQAFAAAARRAGATVRTGTAVRGVQLRHGRVAGLDVGSERLDVETVVLAAGAWSAEVGRLFGLQLPVRPLRRQLVRTTAVAGLPHPCR